MCKEDWKMHQLEKWKVETWEAYKMRKKAKDDMNDMSQEWDKELRFATAYDNRSKWIKENICKWTLKLIFLVGRLVLLDKVKYIIIFLIDNFSC